MKETMLPLFATMAEKAQRPMAAELDDQTDPTLSTPDDYAAPAETVIATVPLGPPSAPSRSALTATICTSRDATHSR